MIYACGRPGLEVVDRLVGCGSVELTAQVRAADDAENLSIHQMWSGQLRVAFQAFSHGLGIGSREHDLSDTGGVNDQHRGARRAPLERL
jgi:hypothetical protein